MKFTFKVFLRPDGYKYKVYNGPMVLHTGTAPTREAATERAKHYVTTGRARIDSYATSQMLNTYDDELIMDKEC